MFPRTHSIPELVARHPPGSFDESPPDVRLAVVMLAAVCEDDYGAWDARQVAGKAVRDE